jgi:hypothetical protein
MECTFCYDPSPKWPPQAILVSDWLIFKNLMAKAHIAFGKIC